jgi:hypothetical protein
MRGTRQDTTKQRQDETMDQARKSNL